MPESPQRRGLSPKHRSRDDETSLHKAVFGNMAVAPPMPTRMDPDEAMGFVELLPLSEQPPARKLLQAVASKAVGALVWEGFTLNGKHSVPILERARRAYLPNGESAKAALAAGSSQALAYAHELEHEHELERSHNHSQSHSQSHSLGMGMGTGTGGGAGRGDGGSLSGILENASLALSQSLGQPQARRDGQQLRFGPSLDNDDEEEEDEEEGRGDGSSKPKTSSKPGAPGSNKPSNKPSNNNNKPSSSDRGFGFSAEPDFTFDAPGLMSDFRPIYELDLSPDVMASISLSVVSDTGSAEFAAQLGGAMGNGGEFKKALGILSERVDRKARGGYLANADLLFNM